MRDSLRRSQLPRPAAGGGPPRQAALPDPLSGPSELPPRRTAVRPLLRPHSANLGPGPDDRRREVAAVLARGLMRYRELAKLAGSTAAQKSPPRGEICLELSNERPLSVSTRGLGPRSDGDGA